jgi:tripartite-type tricarboxylate transporter receptor subunit TctC
LKGFEPIGLIAKIPNIFVVNPALPVKSVADFQRFAKASKDGVTFASSGSGSSIHPSGELLKDVSKLEMLHAPYRGSAVAALLGEIGTPTTVMRGFAAISRTAGLVAHIVEEQQRPSGRFIWETVEEAIPFVGMPVTSSGVTS